MSCSSFNYSSPILAILDRVEMIILLIISMAATRVAQAMSIIALPDNKEVVLGIMANICPLLGEFNTPLGPEGDLRSVM